MAMRQGNNLERMRSVLGKTQTRVGTTLGPASGGVVRASVMGGGEVEVSAPDPDILTNTRVFIKDNEIKAEAPELTAINIDV